MHPDPSAGPPSPAVLGELAVRLAHEAGAVLVGVQESMRRGRVLDVATKISATDPVTAADTAAEARLVELLGQERPEDGLLGEEGADTAGRSGLRWVVDPLDGTVNYLYGLPAWTVSVAVEQRTPEGWRTLAGAVHHPAAGQTYRAVQGEGAWVDDRRLQVNDPVEPTMALVATGFAYDPGRRTAQAATVARLLSQVRDIRRIGSAALDLCRVASGQVDAYYEDPLRRWDMAAGVLIAREAGATVSVTGHEAVNTFGVLAAGPALHPRLARMLAG